MGAPTLWILNERETFESELTIGNAKPRLLRQT
jgi:hypothetical protein